MFPHDDRPDPTPRPWRAALRSTLDLVVAFATLRDADVEADAVSGDGAPAAPRAAQSAAATGDHAQHAAAPRASGPAPATHAHHPHRRPLPAPARARRPGAPRPAPQPCLSPLPARTVPRAASTASR
jgi:hypothetical protein